MGRGRDVRKRTRRPKTQQEKERLAKKKERREEIARRKNDEYFRASLQGEHTSSTSRISTCASESGEDVRSDDNLENSGNALLGDLAPASGNDDDGLQHLVDGAADALLPESSENIDAFEDRVEREMEDIVANWQEKEGTGGVYQDNIASDDESSDAVHFKKGVMGKYIQAIHERVKFETSSRSNNGLSAKWLLSYLRLEENKFWIRAGAAKKICKKLSLDYDKQQYYRDVFVWLPDIQWGVACKPICPNCKNNARVGAHCFRNNHYSRRICDLDTSYFIITRRYICQHCKEKRDPGNGRTIFPKHPAYLRVKYAAFSRNQQCRDSWNSLHAERARLQALNQITAEPSETQVRNQEVGLTFGPLQLPPEIPLPAHNPAGGIIMQPTMPVAPVPRQTARVRIDIPSSDIISLTRQPRRGPDRSKRQCRRCARCLANNGQHAATCAGRKTGRGNGRHRCEYFDEDGTPK